MLVQLDDSERARPELLMRLGRRRAYSGEVQQRTLTSASSDECPNLALAGTMGIRPALPLVRDEEVAFRTTAT